MGANTFQTYGFGKDSREAFVAAVKDAQWEYGHGGYTGTIAEKATYSLVPLPPRVTSDKFVRWIELMLYDDRPYLKQTLAQLESKRAPRGMGDEWRKRKADLRKSLKRIEKERASVPAQYQALVERAAAIYDDKWGPALAFELKGTEAKKAKEWAGLKGTRKRVFYFCGYASS